MKFIRQSLLAAGAFALLAFVAPPVQAANVAAPANGDLFLGVRASGGQGSATSYIVNLGSETTYRNAVPGSTLTLSAIGSIAQPGNKDDLPSIITIEVIGYGGGEGDDEEDLRKKRKIKHRLSDDSTDAAPAAVSQ